MKGNNMNYYKIGINKINGIKEYHDLDAGTFDKEVSWLNDYMTKLGLDLSDLEGKEVFVDHFTDTLGKRRVTNYEITKADYGMFKISAKSTWDTEKTWAFDPKTNLRTVWGNEVHEEWIAEEVQKELEDKIKRLERLTK